MGYTRVELESFRDATIPDLVQAHLDNACAACQSGAFVSDRPYQVEAL